MSDKREILFRGKENPSGNWIEGFLVGNCHIGDWVSCTPVHSKTVGQFTGLTDKNGKKIFEGDIIEHHVQGDILVNRGVVVWIESEARFAYRLRTMEPGFYMHKPETVEVIGNIHDKPELLEEGTNV